MKKESLVDTNPYLKDRDERRRAIIAWGDSTSAVEGVRVEVVDPHDPEAIERLFGTPIAGMLYDEASLIEGTNAKVRKTRSKGGPSLKREKRPPKSAAPFTRSFSAKRNPPVSPRKPPSAGGNRGRGKRG